MVYVLFFDYLKVKSDTRVTIARKFVFGHLADIGGGKDDSIEFSELFGRISFRHFQHDLMISDVYFQHWPGVTRCLLSHGD